MTITLSVTHTASPTTAVIAANVTGPDTALLGHINSILNGLQNAEAFRFIEIATPAAPSASSGEWKLYFKAGGLYHVDDAGNEVGPLAPAAVSSGDSFNMIRNRIFA
jgi:hypothetical protein